MSSSITSIPISACWMMKITKVLHAIEFEPIETLACASLLLSGVGGCTVHVLYCSKKSASGKHVVDHEKQKKLGYWLSPDWLSSHRTFTVFKLFLQEQVDMGLIPSIVLWIWLQADQHGSVFSDTLQHIVKPYTPRRAIIDRKSVV